MPLVDKVDCNHRFLRHAGIVVDEQLSLFETFPNNTVDEHMRSGLAYCGELFFGDKVTKDRIRMPIKDKIYWVQNE